MMHGSRGVYTDLAGHNFRISQMQKRGKHNFMTVPFNWQIALRDNGIPLEPQEPSQILILDKYRVGMLANI